jgi:diguanylate cyclase (GGDEF)-like protein
LTGSNVPKDNGGHVDATDEMSAVRSSLSTPTLEAVAPEQALHALTGAAHELSRAHSSEEVQRIVRMAARALTDADGVSLVIREGGEAVYVDENAIGPLWKGQRIALDSCIDGWAMLNRRNVIVPDVYSDRRIPHAAYRPTFVKSLATIPIRTADPVGSIGLYWAERHIATEQEVGLTQTLADSTALALERIPTPQLGRSPVLSEADPLTGLPSRSAWDDALATALKSGAQPLCVALLDLDRYSDGEARNGGRPDNDLLLTAADAWRELLRDDDLLAQGDDEFVLLLPGCNVEGGLLVTERLRGALPGGETASIGLAAWDGREDPESLIGRADAALCEARGGGRNRLVLAEA